MASDTSEGPDDGGGWMNDGPDGDMVTDLLIRNSHPYQVEDLPVVTFAARVSSTAKSAVREHHEVVPLGVAAPRSTRGATSNGLAIFEDDLVELGQINPLHLGPPHLHRFRPPQF